MKPYHYTECGLRNVWLISGFEWLDSPYGRGLVIHQPNELHRVIGQSLARKAHLTGAELRFLRKEMDLSQRGLGQLLGVTDQAVAKWEKHGRLPKTADRMTRLIYIEHVDGNVPIRRTIEEIAETDRTEADRLDLTETDQGWRMAA
jgi:putative transcriptional regulator